MACETMDQANAVSNVGIAPQQPKRCPLCGATVMPDALSPYTCVCGWGGPGDPLENDRGLAKLLARTDRSQADGQARRDLRRLSARGDAASSLNILYLNGIAAGCDIDLCGGSVGDCALLLVDRLI